MIFPVFIAVFHWAAATRTTNNRVKNILPSFFLLSDKYLSFSRVCLVLKKNTALFIILTLGIRSERI